MAIIITGKESAKARIRGLRLRTNNPEPVWPSVGEVISDEVSIQFATHGAHFGTPWRPLTPEYARRKRARGFGGGILVATGEMRGTFTGRPMQVEEYRGSSALFGSKNQKAIWHHHGTHMNGKQHNPPRPILKATGPMAARVARIVADYIIG